MVAVIPVPVSLDLTVFFTPADESPEGLPIHPKMAMVNSEVFLIFPVSAGFVTLG